MFWKFKMGCAVWHRFRRFIPKHQFIVNLEENKLIGYTEQSISNDVFTFAAKDFMLCTIVWNDFIKTKITCFSTVHVFSSPVCRPLMSYYIQVNLHPDIREAVTDLLRFVSDHITTSVSQLHSIFAFFCHDNPFSLSWVRNPDCHCIFFFIIIIFCIEIKCL